MKNLYLVLIVLFAFHMCTSDKTESLQVEVKPQLQEFIDETITEHGIEGIHINGQDSISNRDSINRVHVLLFNPQKMPEYYEKLNLPRVVAKNVYKNLENKGDFESVDVEFIYEGEYFSNSYYSEVRKFTCKELEELEL